MVLLALVVVALGAVAALTRPWERSGAPESGVTQQVVPPAPSAGVPGAPGAGAAATSTAAAATSTGVSATAPTAGGEARQPGTPEPAPAAPVEGAIDIAGDLPARASISVTDAFGRVRAVSGRTVRLEPGSYSLEFRAPGYDADRKTFTVRAGAELKWTPSVKATAAVTPQPQPQAQPQTAATQATQTQTTQTQTQTQPARDPRADQTAIETEIRNFVAAFARRDANAVLPLLPREDGDVWRQMLTSRDVRNFTALLTQTETPRIDGDHATAQFTISTAYRNLNENLNARLNWIGTFDRTSSGWRLVLARQLRN